jgi:hypothetical protein
MAMTETRLTFFAWHEQWGIVSRAEHADDFYANLLSLAVLSGATSPWFVVAAYSLLALGTYNARRDIGSRRR